jgi:hypothetical protein
MSNIKFQISKECQTPKRILKQGPEFASGSNDFGISSEFWI